MPKGIGRRARAIAGGGASTDITRTVEGPETGFVRGVWRGRVNIRRAFRQLADVGLRIDAGTAAQIRRSYRANVTNNVTGIPLPNGRTMRGVSPSNLRAFTDAAAASLRLPGIDVRSGLVIGGENRPKVPGFTVRDRDRNRTREVRVVDLTSRTDRRR